MEFKDDEEDFSVRVDLNNIEMCSQDDEVTGKETQVIDEVNDSTEITKDDGNGEAIEVKPTYQTTIKNSDNDMIQQDFLATTSKGLATKKRSKPRRVLEFIHTVRPSLPRKSKSEAKLLLQNINRRIIARGSRRERKKIVRKRSVRRNKAKASLNEISRRGCSRCGHRCCFRV